MHKDVTPNLTAGRFARLCGTSKRTLIHYDNIGLFCPAATDERGYRYYSEAQCDVFAVITALKEIGMPLTEIQAYLNSRTPESLESLLLAQQKQIQREMENLNRINRLIGTKLALLKEAERISCNRFAIEQCPEEYLILSDPIHSSHHEVIIERLYEHIDYCFKNQYNIGYPFGAMLDKNTVLDGELDKYAYFFTKVLEPHDTPFLFRKPAGLYAVMYLEGNYYQAQDTYDELMQQIAGNGYAVCGYSYKEGIIDEIAQKDVAHYITRISIQIEAVNSSRY